jgi:hypothetical protein
MESGGGKRRTPNAERIISNEEPRTEGRANQPLRYAAMKSARGMPDCAQTVRKVEAFSVA